MEQITFGLDTQPWIPVRGEEVSLRDVLVQAHDLPPLDVRDGPETAALYGFLAAVVMDIFGNGPEVWRALWEAGRFEEARVDAYLNRYADRLDLFSDTAPFYQVANLAPVSGTIKTVGVLRPEVASGNNVPLFSNDSDDAPTALTPAAVARRIIAVHAWDTAAIKTGAAGDPKVSAGKTTGNPTGPLGSLGVITPLGRTLHETVLLNIRAVDGEPESDVDRPAWRRDVTVEWEVREPRGLRDAYTWQSRRLRVVPEWNGGDVVVRKALVAAGDRQPGLWPDEPRTVMASDAKRGGLRAVRHAPGKMGWRGLGAITALQQESTDGVVTAGLLQQVDALREADLVGPTYPLRVLLVGVVYGNQSAVVERDLVDILPLPVMSLQAEGGRELREALRRIVADAEDIRRALDDLQSNLRAVYGGEKIPWDKGFRAGDRLASALEGPARHLLTVLQDHPDRTEQAMAAWHRRVRREALAIADPMIDTTYQTTLLGRVDSSGELKHTPAMAERFFRARLNKVLVHAVGSSSPSHDTQEGKE